MGRREKRKKTREQGRKNLCAMTCRLRSSTLKRSRLDGGDDDAGATKVADKKQTNSEIGGKEDGEMISSPLDKHGQGDGSGIF